jgi:hypothetical protein
MDNQKSTREIALNQSTINVLNELRNSLKEPQEKINSVNARVADLLTGVCLANDLDLLKEGITLAEDLSKLIVFDLPAKEEATEVTSPKKATKKKM